MKKYSKKEYDALVKMQMPIDDAYNTGKRPQVIRKMKSSIDKVKAIKDLTSDNNIKYLCEEIISEIEDTILEVNKL